MSRLSQLFSCWPLNFPPDSFLRLENVLWQVAARVGCRLYRTQTLNCLYGSINNNHQDGFPFCTHGNKHSYESEIEIWFNLFLSNYFSNSCRRSERYRGGRVLASIFAQLAWFLWNISFLTRNITQFIILEHKKVSHDISNCSTWSDFLMRSGSSCLMLIYGSFCCHIIYVWKGGKKLSLKQIHAI